MLEKEKIKEISEAEKMLLNDVTWFRTKLHALSLFLIINRLLLPPPGRPDNDHGKDNFQRKEHSCNLVANLRVRCLTGAVYKEWHSNLERERHRLDNSNDNQYMRRRV